MGKEPGIEVGAVDVSVERGSGNVFADLGFSNPEEMLVKADLVIKIGQAMKAQRTTQRDLAERVGLDQPKISRLLRGDTVGYSVERLMEVLNRLDQDVAIVVTPRPVGEKRAARTAVAT